MRSEERLAVGKKQEGKEKGKSGRRDESVIKKRYKEE